MNEVLCCPDCGKYSHILYKFSMRAVCVSCEWSGEESELINKRVTRYRIQWGVNPHRKDKRTGAITPVKRDPYTQMHFDEIERVFRGERHDKQTIQE